ncbi:hypothetical protein ADZZY_95 [Mycobacterium phage Adzzy]|uniref:hypothetical protein n=1 Tax=Mycobacterium phage Adzzy TaxID=1383059 RepID=UPI000387EAE0|nr:hypothetical protein ADZZY_95 [Mycobacterium phage Adzzy]AGT14343.1 hypothetical protein ADZZY_95 [Mycobacterium phage Adzzy]
MKIVRTQEIYAADLIEGDNFVASDTVWTVTQDAYRGEGSDERHVYIKAQQDWFGSGEKDSTIFRKLGSDTVTTFYIPK